METLYSKSSKNLPRSTARRQTRKPIRTARVRHAARMSRGGPSHDLVTGPRARLFSKLLMSFSVYAEQMTCAQRASHPETC